MTDDPIQLIKRMIKVRTAFFRSLSNFNVFGKGWLNRMNGAAGVEAKSIAMVSTTPKATAAVEARKASNVAAGQKAAAAASGAGAGGSATQVAPSAPDAVSSVALLGVAAVLVVLVVVLHAKSRINKARADAHAQIAEEFLS